MRYLVDTNMLIAVMARSDPLVARRMKTHRREIGLSSIVLHELYFGASFSKRTADNLTKVEQLAFPLIEFAGEDARAAGEIRAKLRRLGTPIGPFDLLIAGQALARGLTVVTANRREFERVEGLSVEDWSA